MSQTIDENSSSSVLLKKQSATSIERRAVPDSAPDFGALPDLLSRVYRSRGLNTAQDLEIELASILNFNDLLGISQATSLIYETLTSGQTIAIVGDFDADGATSTALAMGALKAMGARSVHYFVPNRFKYGYGLSPEIVELAAQVEPSLIITVDNGISSIEGVDYAHHLGIKVLVTDHHLPGDRLPSADAIVNPNQNGCRFEGKNCAGVGVIFYVMAALRAKLRHVGWFDSQGLSVPNLADYLDLVALGTVADLVPLDKNNRILVEQGLRRIRAGKARFGINALCRVAGKATAGLVASDMGYTLGPRLNAAGRMSDMSLGIECLLAGSDEEATHYAHKLDELNRDRRRVEEDMKYDAEFLLSELEESVPSQEKFSVCLFEPHWHQGVIGILASRIKEKAYRPTIIFAPENDDPEPWADYASDPAGERFKELYVKGSARSVPGFHMRDALDLLAKRHPGLLEKFGGHAMAAGMSIRASDLGVFAKAFEAVSREVLGDKAPSKTLLTDGEMREPELNVELISMLRFAMPWGQGFPEPMFEGVFRVAQKRVLKDKHLKLVLLFEQGHLPFDGIQFNSEWISNPLPEHIRVVYRPDINEFRGNKSVQLLIEYIEPCA